MVSSVVSKLLKMDSLICSETSVINYQSTLRNISGERRFIYIAAEARNVCVCVLLFELLYAIFTCNVYKSTVIRAELVFLV
jgi:hypothetical protein